MAKAFYITALALGLAACEEPQAAYTSPPPIDPAAAYVLGTMNRPTYQMRTTLVCTSAGSTIFCN